MWSPDEIIEWPEIRAIPPPTVGEFCTIFHDIDYGGRGWVTPAEVRAAFDVNALAIAPQDATRAIIGMVELSNVEKEDDNNNNNNNNNNTVVIDDPDSHISLPAFTRCLYLLSLHQREVLPRSAYAVFPDSSFISESQIGFLKLRREIWQCLNFPASSYTARCVAFFLTSAIFLSTAAFCLETLPGLHRSHGDKFATIEAVCISFFTVEVILRASCTPDLHEFVRSPINWIDFLSIAPFYAGLAFTGLDATEDSDALSSSIIRAVRLVRVFRLLKTGRYLAWLRVFGATLADSLRPLFMLLCVASIVVVSLSSVQYYIERGTWLVGSGATWSDGTPGGGGVGDGAWVGYDGYLSGFTSIPATFWWCVVTLTGVGYGDVGNYPISPGGKFFAACCFFCGIVLSSVPISLISGNFHASFTRMERLAAVKVVHAKLTAVPSAAAAASTSSSSRALSASLSPQYSSHSTVTSGAATNVEQPNPSEFALNAADAIAETIAMEAAHSRIDSAWSEPFLRLTLTVTRNSRRSLMSRLKALELTNRERLDEDLAEFLTHIRSKDRAQPIVERAAAAGLA